MGNGGIPTCCGSGHVFDEGSPNSIVLVNSILMHHDDLKYPYQDHLAQTIKNQYIALYNHEKME